MSEELTPKGERGHPEGTGENKRPDLTTAMSVQTEPNDNRKYLQRTMRMWNWPEVDVREPEQVAERVEQYFATCVGGDMKPSVADMACAFRVDRTTLQKWSNGIDSAYIPAQNRHLIKKAYQDLNAQMENYMQNGGINPVAGIFLMKNNMGYQDKQEVVLTPNNQLGEVTPSEELQQKYLEAITSDYDTDE